MKAMIIANFGGPDVFAERELEKPLPGPREVLVRVHGSSVNPADLGARRGGAGPHANLTLPAVLGFDVSGVVECVGPEVITVSPGDAVYYTAGGAHGGGYAEYSVAAIDTIARMPSNLSFLEAAAVPVAGGTAWAALISRAKLGIGETVLIHGGAGGVGSFAVQIAKAAGAFVFATCGAYDTERVSALGADRVLDYRAGNFAKAILAETGGRGVDVSFTTVGGPTFVDSFAATREGGRVVTVTGPAVGMEAAQFVAVGRNLTLHFVHLDDPRPKLSALCTLIERGCIKPLISHTFPLTLVAEAHRRLEQGGEGVYGKIVIDVAHEKS